MRWKAFNYFVANLFRTSQRKYYQNQPSFIEYIAKHFGLLFFWYTVYIITAPVPERAPQQPDRGATPASETPQVEALVGATAVVGAVTPPTLVYHGKARPLGLGMVRITNQLLRPLRRSRKNLEPL